MGYRDAILELADGLALTADAASTNSIDMALAAPNKGEGTPLWVEFVVMAAMDAGSVIFKIQDSADDSSFADIAASQSYAFGDLAVGDVVKIYLPVEHRRYIQAYVDITGTITTGSVDIYLQAP